MKPFPLVIRIVSAALVFLFFWCKATVAGDIRKPAVAGRWYPASRQKLEKVIEQLTDQAQKSRIQIPEDRRLKALILPHAGYVYSGLTAAHASLVLEEKQFDKVILMGPDHRVGFDNGAISDAKAYQTPLGLVKLHVEAAKLRLNSALFHALAVSADREHSLEAILPFLQVYLNKFQLIPIVLGRSNVREMADVIDPLLDENTLLVISSDLSHFLPYEDAVKWDKQTLDLILNQQPLPLLSRKNSACGKIPILVLLELARRHQWGSILLHYSNSGDTAGDKDRVVGYAAIAFFDMKGQSLSAAVDSYKFNAKQGRDLIKLARLTITQRLGVKVDPAVLAKDLENPCFQKRCGTFVTLKKDGRLRGCIGNILANCSVVEGVKKNAIKAAFHDPRFAPLQPDELAQVHISVSILTEPQPLAYSNSSELPARLRPHVDGVIIRKADAAATFLPQVWQQLPKPEKFLSHLCQKAGMPPSEWQKSKLEVWTYQVQYFEEQK
ncbi:MAG: AmmeMemoRadiSam system protein B [Desulfobacterales bacterium]|jgi:hypothetical protein